MTERSPDVLIRPMRPDDVAVAERLTGAAYLASDLEMLPRSAPDPVPRSAEHRRAWCARTAHLLSTDPAGCWVAERSGVPVGVAISCRRDLDRQRREAAHGVDHGLLTQQLRLVVTDHSTGSGYAYLDQDGAPRLLAASNRRTAARLLWEALGSLL